MIVYCFVPQFLHRLSISISVNRVRWWSLMWDTIFLTKAFELFCSVLWIICPRDAMSTKLGFQSFNDTTTTVVFQFIHVNKFWVVIYQYYIVFRFKVTNVKAHLHKVFIWLLLFKIKNRNQQELIKLHWLFLLVSFSDFNLEVRHNVWHFRLFSL